MSGIFHVINRNLILGGRDKRSFTVPTKKDASKLVLDLMRAGKLAVIRKSRIKKSKKRTYWTVYATK